MTSFKSQIIDSKNYEAGITQNEEVSCFYCSQLKKAEFRLNSGINNSYP